MCGRFAAGHLTQRQWQEIVEGFLDAAVRVDEAAPAPRGGYHIRPTNRIALVVSDKAQACITSANWQIVPEGGRPLINARIENDRYWREAWAKGRAMIPALGYFEWVTQDGRKTPYFITVKRNSPVIFFAGFVSEDGEGCVIVTRAPSPQIAHIHTRMPVILSGAEMAPWLSGEMDVPDAQQRLGTDWEGRFVFHPVAPLSQDAEGGHVIEPYAPPQRSFDF
jgi:putative SOS response-associated peptidase YedK